MQLSKARSVVRKATRNENEGFDIGRGVADFTAERRLLGNGKGNGKGNRNGTKAGGEELWGCGKSH